MRDRFRNAPLALALALTATLGLLPRTSAAHEPATPAASAERWVLEFGPYLGYYDFDRLNEFRDFGLFGARLGVHVNEWLRLEGEFDEVYTERRVSGNRARQVTFALHARVEPFAWRLAPMALAGLAFVAYDDADDPDAFGDAQDLGLGARYLFRPRWTFRAEWLLRRQNFQLYRQFEDEQGETMLQDEAVSLWGRAFRVGVLYVF